MYHLSSQNWRMVLSIPGSDGSSYRLMITAANVIGWIILSLMVHCVQATKAGKSIHTKATQADLSLENVFPNEKIALTDKSSSQICFVKKYE